MTIIWNSYLFYIMSWHSWMAYGGAKARDSAGGRRGQNPIRVLLDPRGVAWSDAATHIDCLKVRAIWSRGNYNHWLYCIMSVLPSLLGEYS